ncbi:MAG: copper homeostasis protein CutC, partial [Bacteroidota bacterium]
MTLEIAAFDLDSALRAALAGADRVELCRDASAGGLTPPAEWVEAAVDQAGVPVVVMVRPHADRWTFSAGEHAVMRRDAVAAVRAGASGVVWGALTPDGRIDGSALR